MADDQVPPLAQDLAAAQEEQTDIDERDWLHAVASNPVFDFLKAPAEDLYTLQDGKPFDEEG